jgi:hypothetical protein
LLFPYQHKRFHSVNVGVIDAQHDAASLISRAYVMRMHLENSIEKAASFRQTGGVQPELGISLDDQSS